MKCQKAKCNCKTLQKAKFWSSGRQLGLGLWWLMWSRQFLVANFNKMDFSHLGGDDETFAHLFPDIKFFTLQKNSGVGEFSSPMKCHQDRWGMAFMMVKGEDWRRSSRKDGCHLPLITEISRLKPLSFCQLNLVELKSLSNFYTSLPQNSIFMPSQNNISATVFTTIFTHISTDLSFAEKHFSFIHMTSQVPFRLERFTLGPMLHELRNIWNY